MRFEPGGVQHQFQVRGIHVGVGQDGMQRLIAFGRQVGQGSRDAGLAGAPFAAENDQLLNLFHRLPRL
jgi:hypothetical protein